MESVNHTSLRLLYLFVTMLVILVPLSGLAAEIQGDETASVERNRRTLTLLQQSLYWIRSHHGSLPVERGSGSPAPSTARVPVLAGMTADTIPLSSAPARETWAGERFYLRGEDHDAEMGDRVRVGFDETPLPGLGSNLRLDGNWSMSQQPGDTTMDVGLAWQTLLGGNRLSFSGRHHEYHDEVVSGEDIRRVGGSRQTLEMDLVRNLYQGPAASLDARVITTDVSSQWFENGDLTGEARRSYSLVRLDGYLGGQVPWVDSHGEISLSVEGCMALLDGAVQEACGEKLGAFQRYNLAASLERNWLKMDWDLKGEYQFTPDKLPGWRYLEVGQGMMHGFGGQVLRGRRGGWLRLDSATPDRLLWLPSGVRTSLRFSLLRGWAEDPGQGLTSRATAGEVLWRVSGEHLTGGLRAGTLLEASGPGLVSANVPELSLDISWTL